MVSECVDRNDDNFKFVRYVDFPFQRVDPDVETTSLGLQGDSEKIPLQPAIGKIFEQAESDGFPFACFNFSKRNLLNLFGRILVERVDVS